jgi:hypothetical protein
LSVYIRTYGPPEFKAPFDLNKNVLLAIFLGGIVLEPIVAAFLIGDGSSPNPGKTGKIILQN